MENTKRSEQPFARGQGQPFSSGPFLGGKTWILSSSVGAGGMVTFSHSLRVTPRHIEVVQPLPGEYPSRLAIMASDTEHVTVKFESAQSAGAVLFLW